MLALLPANGLKGRRSKKQKRQVVRNVHNYHRPDFHFNPLHYSLWHGRKVTLPGKAKLTSLPGSWALLYPKARLLFFCVKGCKLPLFEQKLGTCATSLREKFVRMRKVLFAIFYRRSKIREIAFHDKNIVTPWERWLNSARVARCQRPQRPPIKKAKTSSRAKCPYLLPTRFSFQSVALNCHSLSKNWELVLSPYEAT